MLLILVLQKQYSTYWYWYWYCKSHTVISAIDIGTAYGRVPLLLFLLILYMKGFLIVTDIDIELCCIKPKLFYLNIFWWGPWRETIRILILLLRVHNVQSVKSFWSRYRYRYRRKTGKVDWPSTTERNIQYPVALWKKLLTIRGCGKPKKIVS